MIKYDKTKYIIVLNNIYLKYIFEKPRLIEEWLNTT